MCVISLMPLFQAEDSLSLLDIEKNEIVEPSCSTSCTKSPNSVQDSETSKEIDILKSKLALMAEQIKKIEESKLDLLKNYEVVCEKNFALDQQLVEVCIFFSFRKRWKSFPRLFVYVTILSVKLSR